MIPDGVIELNVVVVETLELILGYFFDAVPRELATLTLLVLVVFDLLESDTVRLLNTAGDDLGPSSLADHLAQFVFCLVNIDVEV